MTYKGHVEKGVILVDDPVELPEGAIIRFEIEADSQRAPESSIGAGKTFAERYASVMGKVDHLPEDASVNHDHYLYGLPKK